MIPSSIAPLIGTWRGVGHGDYPTIERFDYREEITFSAPPGKPFLFYAQRTRRIGGDEGPLHAEAGYLRVADDGQLEWMIAQPTGIVEVQRGTATPDSFHFSSEHVVSSKTAKLVRRVDRRLDLVTMDQIRYEMWMEAVGQPHQIHLIAVLDRVGPDDD